ncbi:MAG: 30S ribosomal protein S1 [bacterium]|nr:30S ribosomal protein S1 [bacterium]
MHIEENLEPTTPIKRTGKKVRIDLPTEPGDHTSDQIEHFSSLINMTASDIQPGSIVKGQITSISEKEVTISLNYKSDGVIDLEEFTDLESYIVGSEVEVYFDSMDNEGHPVLSKRKADHFRVWEKVKGLYERGETVQGRIVKRIKGGLVVDLMGIDAFLPGSQVDVHPVRDFDTLLGRTMDFRIIKVNEQRRNVVVSRKVLVEEGLSERRSEILVTLHKLIIEEGRRDVIIEGTVKNITDFGVFVDLGGVDGLLHITDLSWSRVEHPSQVVQLDQKISVKVLSYDPDKQRISLGLKQLQENYWDDIETRFPLGSNVKGKVVSLARYGAFVELENGVEGLVHVSEMSWTQHIKHPSQIVQVGDEVEVSVLKIDRESRKISLGMKQVTPDPWLTIEQRYPINSKHQGIVRDLVPFGAFVELEPEIDGLIHISDLSWTKKIRHPSDILKKGDQIEVMVVSLDKDERRIGLSLKRLESNPWDVFADTFPIHSRTVSKVVRLVEKGIIVELPYGIEGFIPNSLLSRSAEGPKRRNLKADDLLIVEVTEFDKDNRKVILTAQEFAKDIQMPGEDEMPMPLPSGAPTIGDMVSERKEDIEE